LQARFHANKGDLMAIRRLVRGVVLCVSIASILGLLGCGNGAPWPAPADSVVATQNPLVAQYNITAPHPGSTAWVEFGEDTTYGRQTSVTAATASVAEPLTILVAGMKANTTYHMRAHVDSPGGSWVLPDQTFTTGALPSNVNWATLQVTRPNPSLSSQENPGIELIDLFAPGSNTVQAYFTDRDGNVIWYYDVGAANGYVPYTMKLLPNGHMIFSITKTVAQGTTLREVDLAGNTIREMDTGLLGQKMQQAGFDFAGTGYHHDIAPLPNGHVIVLVNYYKSFTDLPGYPGVTKVLGDGLVDLDTNWNPVWAWSAFDHLDVNRHLNGLPDWTHSNAVLYAPNDGNLLLSMRHQSWILKIDYNNGSGTGDVLWRLGYEGDFTLPGGDPREWFSFQHFPSIVSQNGSETTLAVWDNGNNRVMDNSGTLCLYAPLNVPGACYSRAVIFDADESSKVANLQWQDLPGKFSQWGGSVNQLSNGNVEFDINDPAFQSVPLASQVQEVTQTASPQIVWQMNINPINAYRAYRVPSLYPGVAWQR
jgi:arylsulfate sulfotransferase